MTEQQNAPFPLEGGRAGDGGAVTHQLKGRPTVGSTTRARRLRKTASTAERLLWEELRKLKMNFRRQVPIGRYVADFAHHPSRLLIEVDGPFHTLFADRAERDAAREAWLRSEGFKVIRFPEDEVRRDLPTIIQRILAEAVSPPSPTLPPSRGKGE